ncbi:Transposase IS1634 family [Flavobacterium branchiophilum FL-15]|uniref:Transposase IS1634 family n=1 Tax=Flavobacterium branchiophilum (strain FL-15) TaxID=1034807 RepID=G2Z3W1_FLABF|nr:transposase [Flavobacterium branchiophilum]CCB68292.1 Transposase IS1634 family [Flavobacterium branchiophilum FL-15]
MKTTKNTHPDWVLIHKKPNTEIKKINGRFYLYGVKSVYDKTTKRSKKVSLGILGSITQEKGFVPSEINELKLKGQKSYHNKSILAFEYGLAKWLLETFDNEGITCELKKHFPNHWEFIIIMVYCRIGYQAPLKNVPFILEQSAIGDLLGFEDKISIQKCSDLLFELGSNQKMIHDFMTPKNQDTRTVLIDATDIALQSNNIALAQKGYNQNMDFQRQFVLLYLYDATSFKPLYYRIFPGNLKDVSTLKNTISISGLEQCVYIADKGFFSEANILELERLGMQYIIPLRRVNKQIPYDQIKDIELTDNYFEHAERFIFHAQGIKQENRTIELFLDGKLKEQEKNDYLKRIHTLPEDFSKAKFNEKIKAMGTLSLIHNTQLDSKDAYKEYKSRLQIEQFFDHYKNTIDASCTYMQREESLNGWMFINHLGMQIIYSLFYKLKNTPMTKKLMLNHKYSINDTIEHLKSIKKIQFSKNEFVISEQNKLTKTLLEKLNLSIT